MRLYAVDFLKRLYTSVSPFLGSNTELGLGLGIISDVTVLTMFFQLLITLSEQLRSTAL